MVAKIERIANVAVIVVALVMGWVFLKDRLLTAPPQANEVKAGDKLTPLKSWNWSAHDRTLVLALRKGCHFCEDSAPFYQRLVGKHADHGANVAIVAIFPDPADAVNEVVKSEGLQVQALAGVPLDELKVSGTPTLILVDKTGTVLNAWLGVLSPRQELEVMKAVGASEN
jgi:thioredoxin-related protein